MKITLCMIVKNEEKYIEMCLENAFKLADDAIIVDTGSTDRTLEILKKFGDKVTIIEAKWNNDFAEARNISLEKATADWILILDADEKLYCEKEKLKEVLSSSDFEGYKIPFYNIIDAKTVLFSSVYCKLIRNKGYKYNGAIHEQIDIPSERVGSLETTLCKIFHYGYMENNLAGREKVKRNLSILKNELKKDPYDPYVRYNLGVTYSTDSKYDKALDHFIKCHKLLNGKITTYEIDMLKRMAECLCKLKDYKGCITFLEQIFQEKKLDLFPDLHYIKGFCHYELKQYSQAIKEYNKCIEIGETKDFISVYGMGSYIPKLMIARIMAKNDKVNEAVMQYMEAIFDANNSLKDGLDETIAYLKKHDQQIILDELLKMVNNENNN